ncbi:hypothetical protein NBRC110019_30880 [Neptunitalea chrysea]|uniref:Uncharacterized protein n=1 Tax=Neptunitalea chrysea TaxID=1647581 RepID=A0A9W6B8M0_9FLAO|nr:hypothetical protein NBRC110019_30880 [Neptunitalea chrysea]
MLVVEAIITDEYKQQEIKLTNTWAFEEYFPEYIDDATVYLKDENNNTYEFSYNAETQTYLSQNEFSAALDTNYQLFIDYNDTHYTSTEVSLPPKSTIQDITFDRENYAGEDGIAIRVTSTSEEEPNYYRFTHEETIKIVAPNWMPEEMYPIDETHIGVRLKDYENQTCY